jgi:hypothetical protein
MSHTYDVWHVNVPSERTKAATGFEARKAFAAKHHKQVSECMARRIYAETPRIFSDGTSIRSEP